MQIIIKKRGSEAERKKREAYTQIVKHYYNREIRDGARFRTKVPGGKDAIKQLYQK